MEYQEINRTEKKIITVEVKFDFMTENVFISIFDPQSEQYIIDSINNRYSTEYNQMFPTEIIE